MTAIITAYIVGLLAMTGGRGMSKKNGIFEVYNTTAILLAQVALIYMAVPWYYAAGFGLGRLCQLWLGTGEVMQTFVGDVKLVKAFKFRWFIRFVSRFTTIETSADARRVATQFGVLYGLAFYPAFIMVSYFEGWNPAPLVWGATAAVYGLICATARYLPKSMHGQRWPYCELVGTGYLCFVLMWLNN